MFLSEDGFSLLELLLSISLIGILVAVSLPVYQQVQNKNAAMLAANTIEQTVHRATMLARSGAQDSAWGVKVAAGSVTLFSGDSYAARNTDLDEVFSIPTTVEFSATPEMVFAKQTGLQAADQTVTVSGRGETVVTLTILTNGVVNR